jgi:2-methylcitrate dehydratase PrpD
MSIADELTAHVVQTRFESLDKETIERAKWRMIDAIGCLIAGANAPGCRMMLDLVKKWGGAKESTVLVHGVKAPSHNVAMVNSMMTRSYDFEPVEAEGEDKSSPAHISGTTVSTALTVAEQQAASGKGLITALVLGDDLAARLGVASGFDFDLGWDNTGTINMFGATTIAGKLLELEEKQLLNAFGIAINQLAGTMDGVWDKSVTFKLPISLAARNGIFSAELAKQGFSGVKDPFLGRHGYFSLYCRNYNTENLTKNLGKRFYADCIIKPYSSCRATHSYIDTALKIASTNVFEVGNIEEITIHLTPAHLNGFVGQPFIIGETPQVDAAFSIRYTVANALIRKGVKPEHFTNEFINDPRIRMLIDKMRLIPDLQSGTSRTSEIYVKMKDGRVFSAFTEVPQGHIFKTPLTKDEIMAKYRANVAFSQTISSQNADKVAGKIEKLEELQNVGELIRLLIKP